MPKWLTGKVIDIVDDTSTVKRLWIEVDDVEQFAFKAGQFITLDLPIHEKRHKRWRSYSIANPPKGYNIIELCVSYFEGGLASEYLFKVLKVGDAVTFKGPVGVFCIPDQPPSSLIMVCTGTGVVPFRSMIQDILSRPLQPDLIHLIFGTRYKENILYLKEFLRLQDAHASFKYTVVLSREENWEGHTGHVHQIYENEYQFSPATNYYLCGWQVMVDEAQTRLAAMGVPKSNIKVELYG